MTAFALADLVRSTATAILTERGHDPAVLPAEITVERPRQPEHGDYATNVAMQVGGKLGMPPRELAEAIAAALGEQPAISSAEAAGPGFVNVTLSGAAQAEIVATVLAVGADYGTGSELAGRAINLEFVSANPTGPLHLGATRWAAVGDALGRILAARGAKVTREYYFNDAGGQIDRFVASLIAAATGEAPPADGYAGDYIGELAARVLEAHPAALAAEPAERAETFRRTGVGLMFEHIKSSLHDFGTDFDVFFHEDSLHASGAVSAVVEQLKSAGRLYAADGALWMASSEYGDDKDRVVIKNDGAPAYIAADIAYLADKRSRGFDLCLYMLGADHHGYIGRLKAAAAALGHDPSLVEVLIGQMVNLVSDGEPVRMSKRAGTVVTMEDLVEAVGVDAARYELARYSVDSPVDIDLDLLARSSNENPVYYVQYAHARLASLQRGAAELGLQVGPAAGEPGAGQGVDLELLSHPREGDLIRTIGEFDRVVARAGELREPHRIARYLEELAGTYHRFYDAARVLPQGDEQASPLTFARLALCEATRQTLAGGLSLLGVTAPDRM